MTPTFLTVNRKFLITDFRLLSTSVKPENFIDFYRSQKKVKDPRSLQIRLRKRNPYLKGEISTTDLLVPFCSNQFFLILKIFFLQKSYLN
jgi:hypothetical protein